MNLVERLLQKAEDLRWSVTVDDGLWEFEQYSPAGEDFVFSVNGPDIVASVKEYYEDFDPEEHATDLVIAKRNGFAGVPDLRTLCDDADAIDEMLHELADAFVDVESEYQDEMEEDEEDEE